MIYDGLNICIRSSQMLKQIKVQNTAAGAVAGTRIADPMDVLVQAIENAKPLIETRPVRVSGSIYQVCVGTKQAGQLQYDSLHADCVGADPCPAKEETVSCHSVDCGCRACAQVAIQHI